MNHRFALRPLALATFIATVLVGCTCGAPADKTAPTFNGVTTVSVVDDNTLRLGWDAATDDVTPADGIVYRVHQGLAADAVDLNTAVATTAPGALTFDVGGLASGTTYYFVVRAQDAAGNVDANEVVASGATTFGGRPPARQLGSFTLTGAIHRAVTSGNRMYLALGAAGIEVDDITDPPKPIQLSTLAVAESAEDAFIEPVRQLLYVADGTKGLTIIDVQNSSAPTLQSTFDPGLAGSTAAAVAANTEHAYLAAGTNLYVIDVGAPTAPDFLARLALPQAALMLAVEGTTLYALHQGGAVTAWDISEPGPRQLGTFAGPADGKALAVDAQVAYVASPSSGVRLVSFAAPAAPVALGTVGTSASAVAVDGNTVALAGANAFYSYDVSDKSAPQLLTGNPVVTTPDVVGVSRGLGIYIYRASPRTNHTSSSQGVILNIPPYAWYSSPGARSDVPANTPIYFYFSKPMDPASLTANSLTVRDGSGPVQGTATFDWNNTRLLFTPASALATQTTYTVTLSSELKDTRGDALWPSTGITYSFTTAPPVPPPAAPAWLSAIPGDRYVSLSWPYVVGAQRYVLYWSTTPGVTTASNRVVTWYWGTSWVHSGLTNGQAYYYRVAAESAVGEGALSAEVSATPVPPPPPQPVTYLWATPGNQKVTLSWYSVYGATRYNVYWSTTPNAPLASRTRISSVWRPYVHSGLTNNQPYYYVVTAENSGGESAPSAEVMATPYAPPVPGQVTGLWAQGGDARVTLGWNWVSGATWYDVYAATAPGQARAQAPVARVYGTGFTHWGLVNNQPYYYVVVAGNDGGQGADSVEVSALPVPPPLPAPPTDVTAQGGDRRATVYWTSSPYATRYNVYWSTTPGVTRANGQKVSSSWSPFTHWGLTNGTTYYYVVTAENSAGESAESDEVAATPMPPPIPVAPTGLTATAQDKAVYLRWNSVPGASAYTLYFSTSPTVNLATASKVFTSYRSYWHSNLTNGTTYYYVVTASNSGGESLPSAEVSATPTAPPAPTTAPQNVTGSAGDARNYVWWGSVSGASWFNVYWSTSPGVTTASNKVARVWPTWSHWNLTNGTTYYYRVSAENTGGEGPLSAEISLTPQLPPPPTTPTNFTVRAGDRRNDLAWNYVTGATWYDVYWSTAPGVTKASTRIRTYYARSYAHLGLSNGQQYCYAVAAGNNGGESALSAEACGTPVPPPAPTTAPTLTVTGLDRSARLSWTQVQGATLTYVYFKQGPGVTTQNGTRLGVGTYGPYTHYGLSNGTEYCYVATAVNSGGEGPASGEVCVTPTAPPAPGTPTGFSVTPLNTQVRVNFTGVSGALQYVLYWSTQAGVTPQTGTRVAGVYNGWVHAGLTNGTTYYYVLTALNSTGESAPTAQASATPFAPQVPAAPQNVLATAGDGQVMIEFAPVQGATSYTIYWSTQSGVNKQSGNRLTFVQSPYTHTQRTNGTTYYYVVTATNANGESVESAQVSATPQAAALNPPQGLTATASDGQVSLNWQSSSGATSYNLYWSTSPGVTKQTGTKITGASRPYVHSGLSNGTTYYYVVTAQNAGGESADSQPASATPTGSGLAAPTWAAVTPATSQVTLAWNAVSGATSYNLYWAQGTTVSKSTGTKITGVTSPYVHTGRTNGTTYAYVVTAQGASGESADSQVRTATPISLAAPTASSANGYREVRITVTSVLTGIRSYNIYWSTTSGVTPQTGTKLSSTSNVVYHSGATTGQTYYYVATVTTDSGESNASSQVSGTPSAPGTLNLTVAGQDKQVFVQAIGTQGAYSRLLYWNTGAGCPINKQTANVITLTQSSYSHTGLTNGQSYCYLASFAYPEGTIDSVERTATPTAPVASTPVLNPPTPGYHQNTLYWSSTTKPETWNLYWSTTAGVSTSSSRISMPATYAGGNYVHTGLTTGQAIYYRVAGVFSGVEGPLSNELSGTPNLPAPSGLFAQAGFQQIRLSWNAAAGATSYVLYWSDMATVSKSTGAKLSVVTPPYSHGGQTNGVIRYYVVTAVYPDGDSAESAVVSATPSAVAPSGVSASGSPGAVRVSWSPTIGATAYNVYYSTSSTVTQTTGTKVANATSPHTVTGLTYGTQYYFVVTAEYGGTESPDSTRVNAFARLQAPSYLSAQGSTNTVNLNWGAVTGATGYNIYWSTSAGVTPANGTRISVPPGTSYAHTGLTNGLGLYYVVTATDGVNESAATAVAFGLPNFLSAPSVSARAGDQTVLLSFGRSGSYAVYWSTQPTVTTSTGTRVAVNGSGFTHGGLTNGTAYYYLVTEVGQGGVEGPASYVASATPSQRAPQWTMSYVGTSSVRFTVEVVPGVHRYNVYYRDIAGVTKANGTAVNDVFVNTFASGAAATQFTWEHVGLPAGAQQYWVVTAVGPSGESAESVELTARPRSGPSNLAAGSVNLATLEMNLTWDAVGGATGYRVYCSQNRMPREKSELCLSVTGNQAVYTFSQFDDRRYFQVTALDATGESGPSAEVLGEYFNSAPPAPSLFPVGAGNGQAVVGWSVLPPGYESSGNRAKSFNLYYGTSPGVTTGSIQLSNVSATYVHTGLTNGTTYYYRLEAVNASGASALSNEVSVTPSAGTTGNWTSVGGAATAGAQLNQPALGVRGTTPYVLYGAMDLRGRSRAQMRTFNGSTWSDLGGVLNQDPDSTTGLHRVAQDPTYVYALYTETTGASRRPEVVVQRHDGGGWTRLGSNFNTRIGLSLDLDLVSGTPHVLYSEQSATGELQAFVRSWSGSNWTAVGGALNTSGTWVLNGQLGVQGTEAVAAFVELSPAGSTAAVKVLRYTGGSWSPMTLPAPASGQVTSEVAVASSGQNVYVALSGNVGSRKVLEVFHTSTGTFTQLGGVLNDTGSSIGGSSIEVVGSTLFAAFAEADAFGLGNATLKRWTGTAWQSAGGGGARYVGGFNVGALSNVASAGSQPWLFHAEAQGGVNESWAGFVRAVAP